MKMKEEIASLIAAGLTSSIGPMLSETAEIRDMVNEPLDSNGNTMLHYATTFEMVKLLIKHGGDLTQVNRLGRNPVDVYLQRLNYGLVELIDQAARGTTLEHLVPNARAKLPADPTQRQEVSLDAEMNEIDALHIANALKEALRDVLPPKSDITLRATDFEETQFEIILAGMTDDKDAMHEIVLGLRKVGIDFTTLPEQTFTAYKASVNSVSKDLTKSHIINAVALPILLKTGKVLDKKLNNKTKQNAEKKKRVKQKLEEWGKSGLIDKNKFKVKPNDPRIDFIRYFVSIVYHKDPSLLPDIKLLYASIMKGNLTADGVIRASKELIDKTAIDIDTISPTFLEILQLDLNRKLPQKAPKNKSKVPTTTSTTTRAQAAKTSGRKTPPKTQATSSSSSKQETAKRKAKPTKKASPAKKAKPTKKVSPAKKARSSAKSPRVRS